MTSGTPYGITLVSGIEQGEGVVYCTKTWVSGQEYMSSIFSVDHSGTKRITFNGGEQKPTVKDGVLFYLSSEQNVDRILKLESMREPEVVCKFKNITSFVPYGDGALVVVSENYKSPTPFVIRRIRYKHDTSGMLRKRRSLYYADSNEIRKVAGSSFDISDVRIGGDRVIVSASRISDDLNLTDLYEVNVASGDLKKITQGQGAVDAFSVSDKGEVAYLGHRSGARDWATRKLYLPEKGSEYQVGMTAGYFSSSDLFDDAGPEISWDESGIYVMGQMGGVTSVYALKGDQCERITAEDESIRHFSVREGKLAYSYSTTSLPSVLVTEFGEFNLSEGVAGKDGQSFKSGNVEGWCILSDPENPSVLIVHGGPHSAFGPVYNIEIQYFANNGYNVLYCNPRGSMGYGEEFARGSVGSWGEGDAQDIMEFLQKSREEFRLRGKIGIKGVSYGGYMVNWLVTQTQEFSAAISEKGVSNLLSSCGTSDIGYWFDAPEEIGTDDPWSEESIDLFTRKSPITHVKKAKTPTLIIHGEDDHRCPIEQSEQFFTALKFYRVDTVFIRVPGESHELDNRENPEYRTGLFSAKKEWFDRYLKGVEPAQKSTGFSVKL